MWVDTPFCLIGAGALSCHLEQYWRQTYDLDISVSVSLEALPAMLDGLPGLTRHPEREHEWRGAGGVKLDIIPADTAALETGEIVWPKSQARMSLIGFRLAFEHRAPFEIAPALAIDVAPVPVLGLLKIVAYQERPHDRERDLADLAHVLEEYLGDDDSRKFSDELIGAGIEYELASAYAFGADLGALVNRTERGVVEAFVARVRDERDAAGTQARMARLGPRSWSSEPEALLARIEAFERGLVVRR